MSLITTDVLPNNNNKRHSELLDDSLICDDASRTVCDIYGSKNQNNTNILKNKSEIPPKNDTTSSEVQSSCGPPKSKKRKLSSFDELLQNLDYSVLFMNLSKLLFFLESDNNECNFTLTNDYVDLFEMIVRDINILKSNSLDDNYRHISNNIMKAAAGQLLFYVLEYKDARYDEKTMVIKKAPIMDQSGNSTDSISWSVVPVHITKLPVHTPTETAVNSDQTAGTSKQSEAFEKIPVQISSETSRNSDETAGLSKDTMNPKTNSNILNTEAPKTDADMLKPDAIMTDADETKPDAPKSDGPKTEASVLKPDASKLNGSKIDVLKPDALKSHGPKTDVPQQDASNSQDPKTSDSRAPNPEPPQPDVAEPWFKKPKLIRTRLQPKRSAKNPLNEKIKYENHLLCLKNIPKKFIEDALNKILVFLVNNNIEKLVFVPKTSSEVNFYRKCILWLKSKLNVSQFGDEFRELHRRISNLLRRVPVNVMKKGSSVVNVTTGLKEVTYVKIPKKSNPGTVTCTEAKETSDSGESQSSSSCSSRDSSRDRDKIKADMAAAFVPQAPKVAKRPSSEMSEIPKNTYKRRLTSNKSRNEKLMEALSVPVQIDNAMRIMFGMGWSGGALGPRGDGLIEPLMPAFGISRGAGFGLPARSQLASSSHRPQNSNPVTVLPDPMKSNEPSPTPTFASENDIVVQKTRQLLLEDVTFDTIMKQSEPANFKAYLQKTRVEPPNSTTSKIEIPAQTRFSIAQQQKPFRLEMLHAVWDLINSDASIKCLKYKTGLNKKQKKFVNLALQTLRGKKDNLSSQFRPEEIPICLQIREKYAQLQTIVEARCFWDYRSLELLKVRKKFNPIPPKNKKITATITNKTEITMNENIRSYIVAANGGSKKGSLKNMQFKVLFLLHVLKFVKSKDSDEWEVTFHEVLNAMQKIYVENVVEQVNMRIKFGSTPAETKLIDQIMWNVKDAFLGVMFDHEYKVITLSKYYRSKSPNRPDNAVKRITEVTVNLDDISSETLIEPKYVGGDFCEDKYEVAEDNTQVSTENTTIIISDDETSEALPISNELELYDSDDSSVEEYDNNKANAKVAKLLPGEEGVNISNFLYLYDKEKTNAAGIRNDSITNDSASDVTENRNSKNNSGNGNVVIDKNDNQFIDMKRDGGNVQDTQKVKNVDSIKAEYVEFTEEELLESPEISFEFDRTEINLPENVKEGEENDQATTKHSDTVIANYAKIVHACKDIASNEKIVKDDLVIETDCDRIKKENVVLSEEFCKTQSDESSHVKTVDTGTDFLDDKDSEIKNVRIGHTLHPVRKLSEERIEDIQRHISNCIKLATELPLLKCHGVQNGALYYTCYNKNTYDWLQNTIGVASYIKLFDIKELTRMALKLCGYFDFDSNYLFKMLEMYNKEISTKEWVVEKTEKTGNYIIFIVKMDKFSIKYIQESDLALFAGIDKVHFSHIWE